MTTLANINIGSDTAVDVGDEMTDNGIYVLQNLGNSPLRLQEGAAHSASGGWLRLDPGDTLEVRKSSGETWWATLAPGGVGGLLARSGGV